MRTANPHRRRKVGALPHGAAMDAAPQLLAAGKRVIDLSGDFRLHDAALYPRWYAFQHPHPELLGGRNAVYGLTEFHRDQIRSARLVANTGCYATSILLACLPLFREQLVEDGRLLVDAKSGASGAGRKTEAAPLFPEKNQHLRPYKGNDNPHLPHA